MGLDSLFTCIDKISSVILLTLNRLFLIYIGIKGKWTPVLIISRICIDSYSIKELNSAGQSYLTKLKIRNTVHENVLDFAFFHSQNFGVQQSCTSAWTAKEWQRQPRYLRCEHSPLLSTSPLFPRNKDIAVPQSTLMQTTIYINLLLYISWSQKLSFMRSRTRLENIFNTAAFCREMPFTKPRMFSPTFLSFFLRFTRIIDWIPDRLLESPVCNARGPAKHALTHSLQQGWQIQVIHSKVPNFMSGTQTQRTWDL